MQKANKLKSGHLKHSYLWTESRSVSFFLPKKYLSARVTRLGEFPPIGQLLLWAFFENYIITPNVWATLFRGKRYALILTTNGLGYSLGDFFNNSSGHPVVSLNWSYV
jgi:hypothetical protein